jgi:hypothetical protein
MAGFQFDAVFQAVVAPAHVRVEVVAARLICSRGMPASSSRPHPVTTRASAKQLAAALDRSRRFALARIDERRAVKGWCVVRMTWITPQVTVEPQLR